MGALAKRLAPKVTKQVKILTLDIETRPNVVHSWGLFNVNVSLNQIVEPGGTFAVAYKWYHDAKPKFLSDFADTHEGMIRKTHALLDEADIVNTFNGISFDLPHLNKEFALLGLLPPKPYKQVDLLRVVRKQFRFTSNKLDFVAGQFGLGHKTSHEGHTLWVKCLAGEPQAWKRMETYAKQDVALTEKLFDTLRPWIPNMPHLSMWLGNDWGCPSCGNKDLSKNRDGTAYANVQRYRLYQCPECGTWVRGNKKLANPTETRQARIN